MILMDKPENDAIPLPPDKLCTEERLSRLFSGFESRWRLLAVLTLGSVPSNLIIPELKNLARNYGEWGLAIRVVYIADDDLGKLEKELTRWDDEHIIASGDNIHARRFLKGESLPCVKLFDPKEKVVVEMMGFDTEDGLDAIIRALPEK